MAFSNTLPVRRSDYYRAHETSDCAQRNSGKDVMAP